MLWAVPLTWQSLNYCNTENVFTRDNMFDHRRLGRSHYQGTSCFNSRITDVTDVSHHVQLSSLTVAPTATRVKTHIYLIFLRGVTETPFGVLDS